MVADEVGEYEISSAEGLLGLYIYIYGYVCRGVYIERDGEGEGEGDGETGGDVRKAVMILCYW